MSMALGTAPLSMTASSRTTAPSLPTKPSVAVAGWRSRSDCAWRDLAPLLLGGKLVGSGCHLRGFDKECEAVAYWTQEGRDPPALRHY